LRAATSSVVDKLTSSSANNSLIKIRQKHTQQSEKNETQQVKDLEQECNKSSNAVMQFIVSYCCCCWQCAFVDLQYGK
jgi:hypothetical protein